GRLPASSSAAGAGGQRPVGAGALVAVRPPAGERLPGRERPPPLFLRRELACHVMHLPRSSGAAAPPCAAAPASSGPAPPGARSPSPARARGRTPPAARRA